MPLGQAGAVVGRVPLIGVDAVSLVTNEKLRASVASGAIRHVQCPAPSSQGAVTAGAAAKAAIATTSSAFVSAWSPPARRATPSPRSTTRWPRSASTRSTSWCSSGPWPRRAQEDWARLETLVRAGKAKAIGLANASVPIVETVCASAATPPPA